jgi:hypothetical protein
VLEAVFQGYPMRHGLIQRVGSGVATDVATVWSFVPLAFLAAAVGMCCKLFDCRLAFCDK